MRILFTAIILSLFSLSAQAQDSFDPSSVEFPWKNGPTRDATIKLSDTANSVYVFEAFANFCGACNANVPNVNAMVNEFSEDTQVKFFDLGLDHNDRDYATWIRKNNPSHPVVEDVGEVVWGALSQSNYIPQVFVTNCQGTLLYSHVGTWDASTKNAIRSAIAEAKETTCE